MLRSLTLAFMLGGACLLGAAPAGAATFTVTTTADAQDVSAVDGVCAGGPSVGGACTLRAALGQAQISAGVDRIVIPAGTYALLDGLGQLPVASSVTIEGAGARTTTIRAAAASRVMSVSANLTLRDVTLTGGTPTGSSVVIGGAVAITAGDVTLERVWIHGNTASSETIARGGGVAAEGGSLTILDSTISGNTAVGRVGASTGGSGIGGGIALAAPAVIRRSTITGNTTKAYSAGNFSSGGGISSADELVLEHVTLAGNAAATVADSSGFKQGGNLYYSGSGVRSIASSIIVGGAASNGPNCFIAAGGPVTEPAKNISSNADCMGAASIKNASLQLGALANNGGPTDTLRPALGSPAVNAAASCGTRAADQRGGALPAGPACDLGAVEVGADRRVAIQASKTAPAAGEDVTVIATITNDGPDDTAGETVTLELPAGATATTATSTVGTCVVASPIVCTVGTLADGAAATVIATVRASGAASTITAKRAGAVPDSAAGNDSAGVALAAGPVTTTTGGGGTTQTGGTTGEPGTPPTGGTPAAPTPAITGLALVRKPTLRRGARITFTLSQAASVKVVTERLLPGRLSAGRCKAKAKRGKRCTAPKLAYARTVGAAAGQVELTIPAKKLRTGKVRITVVATSAAGTASTPNTVEATVKRR